VAASRGLYLSQTFLAGPHRRVDDLEEELAGPGVEDEDGAVDWLGGQVTLEGLKGKHENLHDDKQTSSTSFSFGWPVLQEPSKNLLGPSTPEGL